MVHEIQRVIGFEKVGAYTLRVDFADESSQVIDFSPILRGELYGALADTRVFDQVVLDPEIHTLVWPNGADFDPAILHDWPERVADLERLAEGWGAPQDRRQHQGHDRTA
jgi:hypothetical protein